MNSGTHDTLTLEKPQRQHRRTAASDQRYAVDSGSGGVRVAIGATDRAHEPAGNPADRPISNLLQRLTSELQDRSFQTLCNRLERMILDASNAAYMRESFDVLGSVIATIQADERRPPDRKDRVAQLYGMMLHVVVVTDSADSEVLRQWIEQHIGQEHRIQRSSLVALDHMIMLDSREPRLQPDLVDWLLRYLQELLEATDVPYVLMMLTDMMVRLAESHPAVFANHFQDIVDIVVGCQLEPSQSTQVKKHCAQVLLAFRAHWCEQRHVTMNLLEQLCEDIAELDYGGPVDAEHDDETNRLFGALLAMVNSVLQFVRDPTCLLEPDQQHRVQRCIDIIWSVVFQLLAADQLPTSPGLLVAEICECAMFHPPGEEQQLRQLFQELTHNAARFGDELVCALLRLLLRYLDEQRAPFLLPIVFEPGAFYELRYRTGRDVQTTLHTLYHRLLALKNVQVLQEAYARVVADLDDVLGQLRATDGSEPSADDVPRLQYRVQFILILLAPLATAPNAIFVTWTLRERPILYVLLQPELWTERRLTLRHYSVLQLACHHSAVNNHFTSSSGLLQAGAVPRSFGAADTDAPPESPTAEHFWRVVCFLHTALGRWTEATGSESEVHLSVMLLLLDWCKAVVTDAASYHSVLRDCDEFQRLLVRICAVAVEAGGEDESIGLRFAGCLEAACQYESLHPAAYQAIAEACCVHGCSAYGAVRTRYITLFSYLPLRYSIRQVNETTGVNRRHLERIRELMNGLYQGAAEGAPQRSAALRICNLRPLCDRLAFNRQESAYVGDYLHELFTTALNDTSRSGAMVRRDLRCLVPWAQWELALQFVSNKLRSPYGRAQDTFQRIEYIVKEYAHVLALGDQSTVQNVRTSIGNQRHARILLGLLEALEKVIYNAAEGTAYALPAPDQSARTFFRVNHATCTEWFSRIRSSVDLIALHCMEPEMAIRYSEAVLRELVAARQTASPLFEHAVLALVRALLRNWESDALHGVYAWCRQVTGRTYTWITMAAEEAAGHRETAATGYRALLAQDTGEMFTEAPVREFVVDQTIYSLMLTCDYEPLLEFLLGEDSRGTQRVTIPLITVTAEQVRSIMAYEAGIKVDASLIELARWDLLDVGENIESNFSCHKMVCAVENSLYGILLLEQVDERDRVLAVSADLLQSYQQECLATHSHEYLFQLTITNHILAKITRRTESPGRHAACDVSTLNVEKQYGTLTLMRVLAWFEFMHPSSAKNTDLRLDVVSSGRKERNYALCRRELQKYYHASGLAERLACPPDQRLTLEEVAAAVMGGRDVCRVPPDLWDENLSRAVYEHCKWLYCQPGSRLEAIELTACATGAIDERLHQAPSGTQEAARLSERVARFLLTCGDWMATANEATAHELRGVAQLAQRLPPLSPAVPQADAHVGAQDRLVGTLLQGATGRCPDLPKAWYALGSWMYRWGQRIVDHHLADARAHADQVAAVLTGTDVPFTTCERIVATLSDHNRLDAEFGLRDALHRAIPELEQLTTPAQLDAIIAHWSARQREVYGYYAAATEAYFRFLQLTSGCGRADTAARSLTVTLRLLRLIVQHAVELREELEAGLATTPSEPWGVITPQLFSRLAHPKPAVQQYVTELLGRVAHDAPHLIVFPVVVGAMQHDPALQPLSASTTEETASGADDASGPYRCFHALRERLRRDSADTVRQVQLVVHELRRISLLWEELWVASLEPIYYDYLKRIPTFETEYYRLEAAGVLGDARRRALLTERHQLLLRPLLFMLEKLQAISARPAETNAERRFRQHVLGKVPPIVEKLRNPPDTGLPFAGWDLFRAFFTSLQQRNHATVPLNLAEVSPVLARLGSTAIAMPGLGSAGRSPIRIRSVDAGIQILQSKTRPKKLTLCGDDGGRYAYLVKGLDDMHLDQCIMQLLKTANLMLPNSIDCNGNVTRYRAEHYSVIPLGSNSGLISWVDKTVPIYTLYSKWLQREALKRRETTGDETIVAARPSDLYAAKVAPLLAERDIAPNTNRREWPLAVLKQVLAGLQQETPRDLLAKELWCHSATANGWWQVTRNYSISLAVMSVLGYIIGLGDRHLNNILVKLATGDIVHIDYNMCFERGKTLRIPEKVPCRLTANLVEALGLTGIEGGSLSSKTYI
uniref:PI3K/PI4K catalytic domain-containing protein n=1 Tax=Anopheles dirus TaxID=7168 RepID=A0A182N0J1_9DIPT